MRTELLVCAATWMELRAWWPREDERAHLGEGELAYSPALTFTLTGIGVPATLGRLFGLLQDLRPVRILNIGIAGAYPNSGLNIGDIVVGTSEVYGDVGFELPDEPCFQSIKESPFIKQMPAAGQLYLDSLPMQFTADPDKPSGAEMADTRVSGTKIAEANMADAAIGYRVLTVRGCTVSTCTGTERTGLQREKLFGVQFESMEGAAVAQAGKQYGIPVSEIRAISNFASTRDMQPDNIRLAIANLRDYLHKTEQKI